MLEIINRLWETSHPWNEILYYSETLTDERLDSELEDHPPELPVLEPSFYKVETVARFNLARDSLQTSTVRTPPIHERTPIHQPHEAPPATALQTPLVPRSQQNLAPHQNEIQGTHQRSHRWVQRSPSSRLRCPTSESGKVFPNGARIPRRPVRCSKTQEGLSLSWK